MLQQTTECHLIPLWCVRGEWWLRETVGRGGVGLCPVGLYETFPEFAPLLKAYDAVLARVSSEPDVDEESVEVRLWQGAGGDPMNWWAERNGHRQYLGYLFIRELRRLGILPSEKHHVGAPGTPIYVSFERAE